MWVQNITPALILQNAMEHTQYNYSQFDIKTPTLVRLGPSYSLACRQNDITAKLRRGYEKYTHDVRYFSIKINYANS